MGKNSDIQLAIDQGRGILRLAPNWVPRSFCVPGRRIKLHPDDYYALGGERGGIDERWFSSTTPADNGPLTGENEGLSEVVLEDGNRKEKILLRDVVNELKEVLIGRRLWDEFCDHARVKLAVWLPTCLVDFYYISCRFTYLFLQKRLV